MFEIMPDEFSSKYPIIFEGREYEVRWHNDWLAPQVLSVYEVYKKNCFFTKLEYKKYKKIYSTTSSCVLDECERIDLPQDREDKFIMYIHVLLTMMMSEHEAALRAKQKHQKQLNILNNWDGNLDTWVYKNN